MLAQRRRRWANINLALAQRPVFARYRRRRHITFMACCTINDLWATLRQIYHYVNNIYSTLNILKRLTYIISNYTHLKLCRDATTHNLVLLGTKQRHIPCCTGWYYMVHVPISADLPYISHINMIKLVIIVLVKKH